MNAIRTSMLAAGLAALCAAAVPAWAHHSVNAQYDTSKDVPMTATLKKLHEVNPHTKWEVVVMNNGVAENWLLEGQGPNVLRRLGLRIKEDIKPGVTYGFVILPSWSGAHMGYLKAIIVNGKRYQVQQL
jgi:hypothetical protein